MSFSWTRVGAILVKELRDYRRNRSVIGTMAATPVLFIILPTIQLIEANVTGKELSVRVGLSLLYMLVIPVMMPSVVSAYSVVGEREQGTLEPVLTTPIRREEFLIAKALAAFVPTLVITYAGTYFTAVTKDVPFMITKDPTTVTIPTPATTVFGQPAQWTAGVTSQVAGEPTPTGTVNFLGSGIPAATSANHPGFGYFSLEEQVSISHPINIAAAREPASMALLGAGLAGLAAIRRRKRA